MTHTKHRGCAVIHRVAVAALVVLGLTWITAQSGLSAADAAHVASGRGPGGTDLANFPTSQDFYRLPGHLPSGPAGTLVRLQTVSDSHGETTLRVMYHSRNTSGHDAAVTGLITYPNSPAPRGGWPVVSWDHGTSGLSQSCAPSRGGGQVPDFGVRSVDVATDYLGLGPDGELHPYLNRVTEAEATIDIVRAARLIPDAHAGTTWFVVGDSQGGQAALAAGEIAPRYAPELHLRGTVAIAPGVELTRTFPGDSPIVADVVETLGLFGAQVVDPSINPNQYLTPAAQGVAAVVKSGCVTQIAAFLVGIYNKTGTIFTHTPLASPRTRAWIAANDNVGRVRTKGPILMVAGGMDTVAVPARINAFMSHLCTIGDRVSIDWYPDGNHGTEVSLATSTIGEWIEARLHGKKPPSSCPYSPPSTASTATTGP